MRENRLYNDEPCCESASQPMQGSTMSDVQVPITKTARNINIIPLNYGYMVEIGCQRFAIESVDKMLKYVGDYLKDPHELEKAWFSGELKIV